ncbi:MAG: hypothetical protein JNM24_14455 [Bdellovibrionaceae bacterium]|nr:hypothetical protein [Pseudobdellovibrionaceae bacterium]
MIQKLTLLVFLVGSAAMAHLQVGVYSGIQAGGQVCQVRVKNVYYLNNAAHPLNERVDIEVQGVAITLQHPPIISSEKKMAYFNHDMFQGILPTQQGAMGFEMKISHARVARDVAIPTEFHLIQHVYQGDKRSSLVCTQLKQTSR